MDETEKQRQRMKNLVLFDMAQTDEEIRKPISKRGLLVMLWVLGAITVALIVLRLA